jgi:RIO-like serine/threonine protein kinase
VSATDGSALLKRDAFGTVRLLRLEASGAPVESVERDTTTAARGVGWLARRLAAREARALVALRKLPQVPRLLDWDGRRLRRSWLPGRPLHRGGMDDPAWFREALRLLRHLHAAGVVHNDLAKEPNWLVDANGRPALVDFQLAIRPRRRGRLFRMLAWDDLRHLLKHKRTYCPDRLTARQRNMLARRSPLAAMWAHSVKPTYRFVTRQLLGWSDREGAGDRGGRV